MHLRRNLKLQLHSWGVGGGEELNLLSKFQIREKGEKTQKSRSRKEIIKLNSKTEEMSKKQKRIENLN